jgi:hypothetical protein
MPEAATTYAAAPVASTGAQVLRRCGGVQCPPGTCDHDGALQRQATAVGPATAPPSVHNVLGSRGHPLDASVRAYLEPRFGHSFGQVRVHADADAAASAEAVGARAYTVGNHIAFAAGAYAPGTDEGRRLIAHELAHVVQQAGTAATPATALPVGAPDSPHEAEAERAADAVLAGRDARPAARTGTGVARQDSGAGTDAGAATDAGRATDAGTAVGSTASGAGSSGGAAPTGGGAAGGGAAPAAPPPNILRVEVENQREAVTYPVPSNLGAGGRQHWVTVAGTRPVVTFRAVLDRPVAATDPAVSGLTWDSTPASGLTAGGDVLHATAPVSTARKVTVRARLGASHAEAMLWAVFVQVATTGPAMDPPVRAADHLSLTGTVNLTGTIFPASIVTDADRPALDGANTVDPPGTTNTCGDALAGGVDHRWDMSRQRRLHNVGTAALEAALRAHATRPCVYAEGTYPAAPEEGNDDSNTDDENNDPYAGGGVITSADSPTRNFFDAAGADGDTMERHLQFREFARLEFNRTWWKVSQFVPWRVHYRAIRVAGQWQDNGSDAAADNAGF